MPKDNALGPITSMATGQPTSNNSASKATRCGGATQPEPGKIIGGDEVTFERWRQNALCMSLLFLACAENVINRATTNQTCRRHITSHRLTIHHITSRRVSQRIPSRSRMQQTFLQSGMMNSLCTALRLLRCAKHQTPATASHENYHSQGR